MIVVLSVCVSIWPNATGQHLISCIFADKNGFKFRAVNPTKDGNFPKQREVYCYVTECLLLIPTPQKILDEKGDFKRRPDDWSYQIFDQWRVESENTYRCYF